MKNKWFVVINPTSGNGSSKKKWPLINNELKKQNFQFEFSITQYQKHSIILIQNAIKQGFNKFICVGGDGTLHNVVNAILELKNLTPHYKQSEIKVGIIPIGTGNDWIKTYKISKDYKKAIQTLKEENYIQQDIGKIILQNTKKEIYFNNLAGIGFDAHVVNKVNKYKNLGYLAYLTGALAGLTSYKKPTLEILFNNKILKTKTLMLLIGLCKYSGGGMQLTKNVTINDGLFDISFIKKITLLTLLLNIKGLFNGKITNHKLVNNYKTSELKIEVLNNEKAYIQADGELIGSGNFHVSILEKAINFIVPFNKS
ncbi:diacylglycerol/lipid kinase family protein [Lutibacter citreus]|uniref:diacylglycerol/lipid kinase family protein n=1 Tax=Lutibacter citreus TaxID=2138210 RepID=UPI000DBE84C7|nr:diacylglycerol kinase family protein [Lutibacter citreus]